MSVVANVAINVDSRDAVSKLRQVQSQSQQTERAIGGLGAAVGKLAAAFGLIQAAKFVFVKTAELESQTRSLQVLTGSAEKAGQIIQQLQQLGAVTPFTSTELIDSAKRLQAFGVETEKVVETTRRLADVSGATGAELQGLVTAYGQVQAKGRLQGEELLQFQERGVALQEQLRKQYGLSGDEFQKALEKGRVGADGVEFAIRKLTDTGGKYANGAIAQSDTLSGKFSTLVDGVEMLAKRIGETLTPVLKTVLDLANDALGAINAALSKGGIKQANDELFNTRARIKELQSAIKTGQARGVGISAGPSVLGVDGQVLGGGVPALPGLRFELQQRQKQARELETRIGSLRAPSKPTPAPSAPPALLASAGGGGRANGVDKAARDAKRLAEELQQSLDRGNDLFRQFSRQAVLTDNITETERKRLQIQYDYQDRAREIAELKDAEQKTNLTDLNNEIRRLELKRFETDELKKQLELLYQRSGFSGMPEMLPGGAGAFRTDINLGQQGKVQQFVQQGETQLKDLESVAISVSQNIGDVVGNSLATGIAGLIEGTTTAKEVFANFLSDIGQILVQEAAKMIATYITIGIARAFAGLGGGGGGASFAGAFGGGGPSFNPGAFSMSSLLGGRANGGPVTGGAPYVVGERGPELFVPGSSGGVMSNNDLRQSMNGGGSPVLNMSFETTRFGDTEYVSRDQLEAAMSETRRQASRDGAQRGMTMTLDRLQQSPRTRSRLGMR